MYYIIGGGKIISIILYKQQNRKNGQDNPIQIGNYLYISKIKKIKEFGIDIPVKPQDYLTYLKILQWKAPCQ